MMFPYDPAFSPPPPVLELVVGHPKAAHIETRVQAQVAPGSDITVLPESAAEAIGLQHAGDLGTEGYDGIVTRWPFYVVTLKVADVTLRPMSVVVMSRSLAILGRDVLNHFILTLSGKDLTFELRDP